MYVDQKQILRHFRHGYMYNSVRSILKRFDLRAFILTLRVFQVPITRTLIFVPISSRRNAMTLLATYSAVFEAPIAPPGLRASDTALRIAKAVLRRQCGGEDEEKGDHSNNHIRLHFALNCLQIM